MAPQKKSANTNVTIPLQHIPNHATRSHFGDNRAATEDQMMAEHSKLMHENGLIDDETAAQMSRPWHRNGELQMQWKPEYLQMHPDYAAGERDGVVSFDLAMRKRRKEDKKMMVFLEDWRAGRVDEEGVKIIQDGEGRLADGDKGSCDSNEESNSELSDETNILDQSSEQEISLSNTEPIPRRADSDDSLFSSPNPMPSNDTSTTQSKPLPKTNASTYNFAPPQTTFPKPTPHPRVRKPKAAIPPPLQPLPNHPSYASFVYGEVAALCRERDLPGGGVTQELRNRLIQDDMNVARGLPREKRRYKGSKRTYKFSAPVVGSGDGSQGGGENGKSGNGSGEDGEGTSSGGESLGEGSGGLKRKRRSE